MTIWDSQRAICRDCFPGVRDLIEKIDSLGVRYSRVHPPFFWTAQGRFDRAGKSSDFVREFSGPQHQYWGGGMIKDSGCAP